MFILDRLLVSFLEIKITGLPKWKDNASSGSSAETWKAEFVHVYLQQSRRWLLTLEHLRCVTAILLHYTYVFLCSIKQAVITTLLLVYCIQLSITFLSIYLFTRSFILVQLLHNWKQRVYKLRVYKLKTDGVHRVKMANLYSQFVICIT